MAACDTWDNAILACEGSADGQPFPLLLSMKRIDPGHANTWFIRIKGTAWSAEFSTQFPKQIQYMPYTPGHEQGWVRMDVAYQSAYPTVTGDIFEFGFSDSLLQMWAAYCDELVNGRRSPVVQCVTPELTAEAHRIFTAALSSQREGRTIDLSGEEQAHG
jgi:predicted dehydrogenase